MVGEQGIPVEDIQIPNVESVYDTKQLIVEEHFTGIELSPEWEWVRHPVEGGFGLSQEGLRIDCKPFIPFGLQSTLILTRRGRNYGFEAKTKILFNPVSKGEEAGITLYRDSDAFLFLSIRRGIGQTSGQAFDVTKLHENQEYDGLYIELDQYVNVSKKILARIALPIESGDTVWLRVKLDERSQTFTFYYSVDDIVFTNMGIEQDFCIQNAIHGFCVLQLPELGFMRKAYTGNRKIQHFFQKFSIRGI